MKDPAFLFYPGDYLRDTQNFSEKTQVAYDRIMCEHMRNICIRQRQLNFFTKRLTDDEVEELMSCLIEIDGGFQIEWVAESINKRRAYSESRRQNRAKKTEKDMNNICNSYDEHMENENENVIVIDNKEENVKKRENDFQQFWDKFHEITKIPKTDLASAKKYWKRLTRSEQQKATSQIEAYYKSLRDKTYCKKARTYLADKNFNDEFKTTTPIKIAKWVDPWGLDLDALPKHSKTN